MNELVCLLLTLYIIVLFARMVFSWVRPSYGSPFEKVASVTWSLTEPVLRPLRNVLPPLQFGGVGLDLSFTIVFILLMAIRANVC